MQNIIQLLPDSVANQIAAGEVVQRPASVVKELLENAIDAGSTEIKLIVKDAGRTLIQVIDNGKGMTPTDARMAFERHATSKLKTANDLFNLHTKGFRGEALASIAAVAQVELKTKPLNSQVGTLIQIEGNEIIKQEPCTTNEGSSFMVKNLFYNIPARRNFLKSNQVELKHIIDEFQRVALAHPDLHFIYFQNDSELYNLPAGKLKSRIVQLFGAKFNERLAPVSEFTDVVGVEGFIAKPEFAKKTRGEQFFFANNRYIKHPYFHHAVTRAFEGLIKADEHPIYFLFLTVEPNEIDVNIHPTKTEVKFQSEKIIYPLLMAAVRKAIGTHNFMPSLDFENDNFLNVPPPPSNNSKIELPEVPINEFFNPFTEEKKQFKQEKSYSSTNSFAGFSPKKNSTSINKSQWTDLYEIVNQQREVESEKSAQNSIFSKDQEAYAGKKALQIHGRYLITQIKSGLVIVDKFRALERIYFEQIIQDLSRKELASQTVLFPYNVELNLSEFEIYNQNKEIFSSLGFDIEIFGKQSIVVNGLPDLISNTNPEDLIVDICRNLIDNQFAGKAEIYNKIAADLAFKMALQHQKNMGDEEIASLIDKLFACEIPFYTAKGKSTLHTITNEELEQKFNT